MALANLFTRLTAAEEDVKSPGQPAFARRSETENDERRSVRKRKTQGEQTGPYKKKRSYQAQTTRSYNATVDDSKTMNYQMHNTDREYASAGSTKEVMYNHSDKSGHNNISHKSQRYKTKNNRNVDMQKEQTKEQKNQLRWKERGRPCRGGSHQTRPTLRKGGGDRKNTNNKQNFQVKHTRFMTQEFKDQNVLLVDGRLLCRHFLWGRCIKGDDCQLEHVQGYNDLVKELCKFYVQGFCAKGGNCPYMHKSFPCKFFHRKGKCSQGADCRFSHEPLNDLTNKLLDEALKRENDLYELAKKAEQESSGQPANTDESEMMETNRAADILLQPLRPNFYKSADTNAEKEALFCPTEELPDTMEEAVPPHASDAVQPHSLPSTNLDQEEPVCYSVEAVLGTPLSKPFTSLFTTPRSKEFIPLTSSDCPLGSANQSQVPYSVDAVLRSCKSMENSTFGHTPTPPTAQTVSYTPKTYFEQISDPPPSSETQNKEVHYSVRTRNEAKKSHMHTSLSLNTCPDLSMATGDHKKQSGNMPESLTPAQRASHEVKLELLSTDVTCSVNSQSEGVCPFGPIKDKSIFSCTQSQTSTSKHPTQLKPDLLGLTSDSFVPAKAVTSLIKSSDSANAVSHHFATKQPTEIHLHSKETQSGLRLGTKQHYSAETTAECSSKMAHCGDVAIGCKRTLKRPFHRLFASPITDTVQPIDDSVTSPTQASIQSSCPAPQSADCRNNHLKTAVEPDKASAKSFLSLFAAPLSGAPLPRRVSDDSRTSSSSQQSIQSVGNKSNLSDSKQRASNLETPLSYLFRPEEFSHMPRSPNFTSNPEIGKESSAEDANLPTEQHVISPTSPTACDDSSSTSHAYKQLPDISHKGSAVAATANSVLKTLFLCLSPYQHDGEQPDSIQICIPSESEKDDKTRTECVSVKQQRKSRNNGRQKKFKTRDSHKQTTEKRVAHGREHQPSPEIPQISSKATGASTLSSPGTNKPQMRDSGTDNLPFKPVVPPMQHHTQRLKVTSEEGKRVNGNVAATPLNDLFKTLDTAVFH